MSYFFVDLILLHNLDYFLPDDPRHDFLPRDSLPKIASHIIPSQAILSLIIPAQNTYLSYSNIVIPFQINNL